MTVRGKIDREITRRVGSWFTVRDLQDKLSVENSTLKPLIMRYARDQILRRRKVKGEARAVQFSPAARSTKEFESLMGQYMPYKAKGSKVVSSSKKMASKKTTMNAAAKKRSTTKKSRPATKKTTTSKKRGSSRKK